MKKQPIKNLKIKFPHLKIDNVFEIAWLSVKIYFQNFWFIYISTLILYIPIETIKYLLTPDAYTNHLADMKYDFVVSGFINPLIQGIIIYGVVSFLNNGKSPSIIEAYSFGFRKWLPIFLRCFQAGFFILFGAILLIIPGLVLLIAYSFIFPIICIEGQSKKGTLKRSAELTKGNRWLILFSSIAVLTVSSIFAIVVSVPIALLGFKLNLNTIGFITSDSLLMVPFQISTITILLIYIKASKDWAKNKSRKELWFLRWAV